MFSYCPLLRMRAMVTHILQKQNNKTFKSSIGTRNLSYKLRKAYMWFARNVGRNCHIAHV